MARHRLVAALFVAGVLGVVVGAAGMAVVDEARDRQADDVHLIVPPGGNEISQILTTVTPREIVAGDMVVCLDRPGAVAVEGVTPIGELHLTGYAVRVNPFVTGGNQAGTVEGTLEDAGVYNTATVLTHVCGEQQGWVYEVVVELEKQETTTHADGFRVRYHVVPDGPSQTMDIPFAITYCATTDTTEECQL